MKDKILIVENDWDLQDLYRDSLSDKYILLQTDDIKESIKFMETQKVAVVITDYRLGQHETPEMIIDYAMAHGVPSIMTSGKSRDTNATYNLMKPFELSELEKTIVEAIKLSNKR